MGPSLYSARIATSGLTRAAPTAGIEHAIRATSVTAPATAAKVTGSRAGISKSSDATNLEPARALINPVAMPTHGFVNGVINNFIHKVMKPID